jgi:hypothetical protein
MEMDVIHMLICNEAVKVFQGRGNASQGQIHIIDLCSNWFYYGQRKAVWIFWDKASALRIRGRNLICGFGFFLLP